MCLLAFMKSILSSCFTTCHQPCPLIACDIFHVYDIAQPQRKLSKVHIWSMSALTWNPPCDFSVTTGWNTNTLSLTRFIMVCCVSPIPAASFLGPHSESAILHNSEVFEDHNRVGTFHMYTISNHWKILSRELKLCDLCFRKIPLGKLYSRPCLKKKKKKKLAANSCIDVLLYLFKQRYCGTEPGSANEATKEWL